jgi:proteasome assembly chaperone (PAC2) family protein
MEHVIVHTQPQLRRPILLAAFAGWNDAGETATMALRLLIREWQAEVCAEIDPEPFFVFTETRPHVRGITTTNRQIIWPQTRFYAAHVPTGPRDFLLLLGIEPQLRWRTFVGTILEYSAMLGVDTVFCLGGLLADSLHTRPPVLTGSISDPALSRQLNLLGFHRSRYEGPTGIVGVLGALARERGLISGSLWGNVPHYLGSTANPVVAAALLRAVAALFQFEVDLSDLDRAAERFNAQVSEAVANDPEVARYVRQLEEQQEHQDEEAPNPESGGDLPSADIIVQQLEDLLRRRQEDQE